MKERFQLPRLTGFSLTIVFSILAVGILATGYYTFRHYERNYRIEVERQLSAIAELKIGEITRWRMERFSDCVVLFRNRALINLVNRIIEEPGDSTAFLNLKSWLDKLMVYRYNYIRLVDVNGKDIISLPEELPPLSKYNISQIPSLLELDTITFQDFYFRNSYDTNAYLAAIIPIRDQLNGNKPIGMLMIRIDPNTYLYPLLQTWPSSSRTAETLLIRRDKDEVVYLNELKFHDNAILRLHIPIDRKETPTVRVVLGERGIMEGIDYRGVSVISYAQPVPDSPWFIVTKIDKAELFAPVRDRLLVMIVLVFSMLLAAGSMIGYLYRLQKADFYRERYLAAEALQEKEFILRSITDTAQDSIVMMDEAGRINFWNPAAERMFGYNSEEAIGQELHTLISPVKFHNDFKKAHR